MRAAPHTAFRRRRTVEVAPQSKEVVKGKSKLHTAVRRPYKVALSKRGMLSLREKASYSVARSCSAYAR